MAVTVNTTSETQFRVSPTVRFWVGGMKNQLKATADTRPVVRPATAP